MPRPAGSSVKRLLKQFLKWFALAFVVFVVLFLGFGNIDEALEPEARAYATPAIDNLPPQDNAYFALFGFWYAEEDNEIGRVGESIVREYEDTLAKNPRMDEYKTDTSLQPIKFAGDEALLCRPPKNRCLNVVTMARTQIQQILHTNKKLLDRYLSLYSYSRYRNVSTPRFFTPMPRFVGNARYLALTRIALDWHQGESSRAIAALARDTEFWRRMLRDSDDLLMKAIATRAVAENVRLLAEMIVASGIGERDAVHMQTILRPLDVAERDFMKAMKFEFLMGYHTYHNLVESTMKPGWNPTTQYIMSRLASLLYAPNACVNKLYRLNKATADLATLPASRYDQEVAAINKLHPKGTLWEYLHNPIGNYLMRTGSPDWTHYPARIHDLDGLMRLALVAAEIKRRSLRADEIQRFLNEVGEPYTNPYTGKPFEWDADMRTIHFRGRGSAKSAEQFIEVRIFN